jgi:rod shape-determining protein MreC
MLGTLDRTPPPFFRQGYSALTKLVFFSALSIFCMVADQRLAVVAPVRMAIGTALAPVQHALLAPSRAWDTAAGYWQGLTRAVEGQQQAERDKVALAEQATAAARLAQENARLRALLALGPALQVRTQAAEVLYEAADPFSRKVIVNRGTTQGVAVGSPVINEQGVIGQITRVYAYTAEVTLVTDRDAAVPVLNTRTQQRGAAFGGLDKGTAMELRFVLSSADLQVGDPMHTSGLDGVYPSGLAVGQVSSIERQGDGGFARVLLRPAARLDGLRHVLIVEPVGAQLPPRPVAGAPNKLPAPAAAGSAPAGASSPAAKAASAPTAKASAPVARASAPAARATAASAPPERSP